MKHILFAFLIAACFASCGKDDQATPPPTKINWAANSPADSSVLAPNTSILLATNFSRANFNVSRGSISDSGRYVTSSSNGKFTVVVKNPNDATDSIKRTFFVSSYKNLFDAMAQGGYAISFRHGAASDGSDNFAAAAGWHTSCSNAVARQLTPTVGPQQCIELGQCLKIFKLPIRRIFSSEFCRCKTTADLFAIPNVPVVLNKDITYYVYDEANRYTKQLALMGAQPQDNSNTILVGHAGFASTPDPSILNNLNWGDAAVFKLNGSSTPMYVSTISESTLRAMLQ